jgi:hypothetical protein
MGDLVKAVFASMFAISVLGATVETARGQTVHAFTEYSLSMDGRKSNDEFISLINKTELDEDFDFSSIGESFGGGTDLGTATVRAAAFAGRQESPPGAPPTSALLGVQVAGSSTLARPPLFPDETGNLMARAIARAKLKDSLNYDTPGNTEPIRVQGFFRLTGSLNANANANGTSMFASADAQFEISGNVIATSGQQVFSTSATNDFRSHLDPILFSYTTKPGTPTAVEISMLVSGEAAVTGPRFNVNDAGFGFAEFNASYEHTLSWGAITSVTKASTGEPILNWTVASATGFDYTQVFPLPEPSPSLLLFVGMGRIRARGRRRPSLGCISAAT